MSVNLSDETADLRRINEQLSSINSEMAELLSCGIIAYTLPERKILLFNHEGRRIFEVPESVTVASNFNVMSRMVPEDREMVRNETKKLVNPGDRVGYVFHNVNKDGSTTALRCETKLLSFSDGGRYILSCLNDITEQEAFENRLREERRQYRKAIAIGSDAFITVDLTEGMLNQSIIGKNGKDFTAELGVSIPAYYDDLARAWFSSKRIEKCKGDIELLKSRRKLISAFKQGVTEIDAEYRVPAEKRYIRMLTMLYKADEHIYVSFIIYDDSERAEEDRKQKEIIKSLGGIYSGLYYISLTNDCYTVLKQHDFIAADIPETGKFSGFGELYADRFAAPEYREKAAEFFDPDIIRQRLMKENYITTVLLGKNMEMYRVRLVVSDRDSDGTVISAVYAGCSVNT